MDTENLISLTEFAQESGLKPSEVTRLITPARIIPEVVGGRKFIDKLKYPPENFKKA